MPGPALPEFLACNIGAERSDCFKLLSRYDAAVITEQHVTRLVLCTVRAEK